MNHAKYKLKDQQSAIVRKNSGLVEYKGIEYMHATKVVKVWKMSISLLHIRYQTFCGLYLGLPGTPRLKPTSEGRDLVSINMAEKGGRTFLNVFRPAKMEPPIHVEYLRSGGAYILILTSFSASFFTSLSNRSPKPVESRLVCHHVKTEKIQTFTQGTTPAENDI